MPSGSLRSPDRSNRPDPPTEEIRRLFARYRRFAERPAAPAGGRSLDARAKKAARESARAPLSTVR